MFTTLTTNRQSIFMWQVYKLRQGLVELVKNFNSFFNHTTILNNTMEIKLTCWTVLVVLCLVMLIVKSIDGSIAYFESYGWPSYGIVKPFWMRPFSEYPARSISGYSRKHFVRSAGIILGSSSYWINKNQIQQIIDHNHLKHFGILYL